MPLPSILIQASRMRGPGRIAPMHNVPPIALCGKPPIIATENCPLIVEMVPSIVLRTSISSAAQLPRIRLCGSGSKASVEPASNEAVHVVEAIAALPLSAVKSQQNVSTPPTGNGS